MPIYASAGSGTKFQPAPTGAHAAVCCDIVDLGIVETTWQGVTKKKHMIRLVWQIAEPRDDGKPYLVMGRYNLSLHENAALRRDLEGWRGRPFTEAELHQFDVENVLDKPCMLNLVHRVSKGETYANVAAIMPLPKGMTAPTVRDYVRVVDRVPEANVAPLPDAEDFEHITADMVPF